MDAAFVTLAGFTGLVFVLKKLTERVAKWTGLRGDWLTAVSVLLGWGLARLFTVDPSSAIAAAIGKEMIRLDDIWLYLLSGIALALAAGFTADREELKFGVRAGQTYDEGYNAGDPGVDERRAQAGLPPV